MKLSVETMRILLALEEGAILESFNWGSRGCLRKSRSDPAEDFIHQSVMRGAVSRGLIRGEWKDYGKTVVFEYQLTNAGRDACREIHQIAAKVTAIFGRAYAAAK